MSKITDINDFIKSFIESLSESSLIDDPSDPNKLYEALAGKNKQQFKDMLLAIANDAKYKISDDINI
jgi:hypothetical protein